MQLWCHCKQGPISVLRPSYWLLCTAIGCHNLEDAEIFLLPSMSLYSEAAQPSGAVLVEDQETLPFLIKVRYFSGKGKFNSQRSVCLQTLHNVNKDQKKTFKGRGHKNQPRKQVSQPHGPFWAGVKLCSRLENCVESQDLDRELCLPRLQLPVSFSPVCSAQGTYKYALQSMSWNSCGDRGTSAMAPGTKSAGHETEASCF